MPSSSSMPLRDKRTLLGVEPTKRGLAFAVFDRGTLLDWGRANRSGKFDELALFGRLVARYGADAVVLEDPDAKGCRRGPRVRRLLRKLSEQTKTRRIRVLVAARQAARDLWRANGRRSNEAIAGAVAEMFPVLRSLVPRPRKSFMPEDERVRVFGAVMLVLAVADRSAPIGR